MKDKKQMSEKEEMLKGEMYDPTDKELSFLRQKAHLLNIEYNKTGENRSSRRTELLNTYGIKMSKNVFIQGPVFFDYGCFTSLGENFYANFNLTVLDTCPVNIGNNVFIGPNVTLATPLHSLLSAKRNQKERADGKSLYDEEYGAPITIDDNVWIAANVFIGPGVHIGHDAVIGAGSVVLKDVPPKVLAFGNPCRVIREITDKDK